MTAAYDHFEGSTSLITALVITMFRVGKLSCIAPTIVSHNDK